MTTKAYILEFLDNKPNGVAGGIIEDYIRNLTGSKGSTTSRICRHLYEEGKLQRTYINNYVWYRKI